MEDRQSRADRWIEGSNTRIGTVEPEWWLRMMCGQLDERLQECGGRTVAAAGEPQFLPGLVRFPVEAMVKEVYAAQVGAGGLPISCVDRLWPFTRNAMAMAARVAVRMRKATRHVGIGRERLVGQKARLWFGLRHTSLAKSSCTIR